MYALVTYDGYALDVVDGALDEAIAHGRSLGAHEVIFDESYDLSQLFSEEIEELERAANPVKKLRKVEEKLRPRRLAVLPTPGDLSPGAAAAVEHYYRTGEFPKKVKQKEALEILRHLDPAGRLQAAGMFTELEPAKAPEASWAAANRLKIRMDDVLKLDPNEAFEQIERFRADRLEGGERLPLRWRDFRAFMTPRMDPKTGLASTVGYLGTNHKLEKSGKLRPAHVMGLSLLPQKLWQLGFDGDNPQKGTFNACIGASPECAQACLVYSGRNTDEVNEIKAARMDALIHEPIAFARLLVSSIQVHHGGARGFQQKRFDGYVPFVRLNVFSDLPWELMFPELFDYFDDLSFYDYTKIPGRERTTAGMQNYDLTFSWSGMNARGAKWTLEQGGKVAMVFFKSRQEKGFWRTHTHWRGSMARMGAPPGPMPASFMGAEVIDGTVTDVRPYDRVLAKSGGPLVVGLKYIPPSGQAFDKLRSLFIVPVQEHEGTIYAAVIPRDQPGVMESQLREDYGTPQLRPRVIFCAWPRGASWGKVLRSPPPRTHAPPDEAKQLGLLPWTSAFERLTGGCCGGYGLYSCGFLNNIDQFCDGCVAGDHHQMAANEEAAEQKRRRREKVFPQDHPLFPGWAYLAGTEPTGEISLGDVNMLIRDPTRIRSRHPFVDVASGPRFGKGVPKTRWLAPTLTASLAKGVPMGLLLEPGATFDQGATVEEYDGLRRMTVREAAKLMDVPQWYIFEGTVRQQYRQIGNGVPVNLGRAIARHVLRAFGRKVPARNSLANDPAAGLWQLESNDGACTSYRPNEAVRTWRRHYARPRRRPP